MNNDQVLISTHDLSTAGLLRDGFKSSGYSTDLVTPDEELSAEDGAVLLVLTGGAEQGENPLVIQARDKLQIPVFIISSQPLVTEMSQDVDEVFDSPSLISDVILLGSRLIERRRLQRLTGIVGETDAMSEVLERVVQIAPVESTVLVTGESGTGKELVARGIHALSPRRHEPFIAVNVAALSDTLLESELFGHEKGAFTGAIASRRGLFEVSNGGTIFLDEIGDMALSTQTNLLRVLEQKEFHKLGGEQSIKVDVRIVAATNQDLRRLVSLGQFRRDLYFRLNVLSIILPALRDRKADVPTLVETFVVEASNRHDRDFHGISSDAMEILINYSWPGNVRELKNLVESMVVLAPGRVIRPEDIPEEVRTGGGQALLPALVDQTVHSGEVQKHLKPELEFVFRTLVDLRLDMDDLRREFEAYRSGEGLTINGETVLGTVGSVSSDKPIDSVIEIGALPSQPGIEVSDESHASDSGWKLGPDLNAPVVFRPGMTMEDVERNTISAVLSSVGGNRRKAAKLLGIGERTLYRKISKYELDE